MSDQPSKIGVFVCHCGGNISDYVDVERVRSAAERETGVALSRTQMFACSDASQAEMAEAIEREGLDGIVVASCSPKLHLHTFRHMAQRAGLNPYRYAQVNLREQCSWSHRNDFDAATAKGVDLVRAGIARARTSESLQTFRVETTPAVLVVGAGVAGLRAAVSLADLDLTVYVVERAAEPGGWTAVQGLAFPSGRPGAALLRTLQGAVAERENIKLFTSAEVVERGGSVGNFQVGIRVSSGEVLSLEVGTIIVATGFEPYSPADGEFGRGLPGVVTLPEFDRILAAGGDELVVGGRRIHTLAYIYCVGSRQTQDAEHADPHRYCSRFCCTAAVHAAVVAHGIDERLNQYHLYQDMRTYGKNELLFEEAGRKGSVFLRFDGDNPPEVRQEGEALVVSVADQLDGGETVEIPVDLVVLVTGAVPRRNDGLVDVLKLPVGTDGFFNEIHPKLRPVETVLDGVLIAGAAQGPKTIAESVTSSLAAVSKSASLLLKGHVELEPFVAVVDPDRCTGCDACLASCPYSALVKTGGKDRPVEVSPALCKGCGGCVPVCPEGAIDVVGYTDRQITRAIDALIQDAA
jgi:heterodisulfide reductase subunit A